MLNVNEFVFPNIVFLFQIFSICISKELPPPPLQELDDKANASPRNSLQCAREKLGPVCTLYSVHAELL